MSGSGKVKARLVRSPIGYSKRQKDTVRSLGFTRMNQTRELPDNPAVRGMIAAICHLVKVVDDAGKATS